MLIANVYCQQIACVIVPHQLVKVKSVYINTALYFSGLEMNTWEQGHENRYRELQGSKDFILEMLCIETSTSLGSLQKF